MARYYWPMTDAQRQKVNARAGKRLAERFKAAYEGFPELMPFIDERSGRERLAFYRSTDQEWWDNLIAADWQQAHTRLLDWAALSRRYGPPVMLPQPVSNGAYA